MIFLRYVLSSHTRTNTLSTFLDFMTHYCSRNCNVPSSRCGKINSHKTFFKRGFFSWLRMVISMVTLSYTWTQGLEKFYSDFLFLRWHKSTMTWLKGEPKTSKKPKFPRVKHSCLEKQQSIKWHKGQIKLPYEFLLLLLLLVFSYYKIFWRYTKVDNCIMNSIFPSSTFNNN